MPQFEHITLIIESLPGARAQVQVNIPTPMPGMRLETPAHSLAIDALGWLGKQPAVAGFVYGGLPAPQAMTGQQRIEAIRSHHVRAGKIICMASATSTLDEMCAKDLIDDLIDDITNRHPSVQQLQKAMNPLIDEGEDNTEALLAHLSDEGFHGYAIEFNSPADECGDEPYFGSFYTTWIYADTIEQAWQMGIEWAKKMKAHRKQEQAA